MTSDDGQRPRHDPLAALRIPAYRLYLASRAFSGLGGRLLTATMAWHLYELTDSALSLGLLGLARFLPALMMSMIGGAAADAYNRKMIIQVTHIFPLGAAAVLAAMTFTGDANALLIYGLVIVIGFASSFEGPARASLLPSIVPASVFPNAVTMNSTVQTISSISGPVLSGALIALADIGTAYSVHIVLSAASLLCLSVLPFRQATTSRTPMNVEAIKEGVRFVRGNQVLIGAMSLDMFAVVFGGATALLPIYARDILDAGEVGYGILAASFEVGAFVTAFTLVMRRPIQMPGRALLIVVVLFGLGTIAFGLSRSFLLSCVIYGLIGAIDQISMVMRQTTIQLATPDALRGRVSSVNQLFVQASNEVGAMESGFVAAITSATFAVVSGGVGCLSVAAFFWAKLPGLRQYRIDPPPAAATPATAAAAQASLPATGTDGA